MGFAKKFRKRDERKLRRRTREERHKEQKAEAQAFAVAYNYAHNYIRQAAGTALINITTLFFYVLHKHFGFGRGRADKVFDKAVFVKTCIGDGYITYGGILDCIVEETGADFHVPENEYRKMSAKKRITAEATNRSIALYMFAVYELFGFKKKRLERIWDEIESTSEKILDGELTWDGIESELAKVHITFDHNIPHREERSA